MSTPASATLAAASLFVLAAASGQPARAAQSSAVPVVALPTTCTATTSDPFATDQWTARNFDPKHSTRLMELKWIPDAALGPDLGRIECIYAPYYSRFPYPALTSNFSVQKPLTPGWMRPSPNVDWLLCSGATMTHFDDPSQCPFVPAGSDRADSPDGYVSPF